ncbi:MAG TPA: class I SAM-dependent methyltransferase [Gemmatimonadaceae bacterium]
MTSIPISPDAGSDEGSKAHWEAVYGSRSPTELSWYQPQPTRSLELLEQLGLTSSSAIIDVGGGTSTLVDALLDRGVARIAVLDISRAALEHSKARLGARAASVEWIEADITRVDLGANATYDVWHDRAVFHFLTHRDDRRRYVAAARRAIRPGGVALIATFSLQGPTRCSGLDVVRYDSELLARELGNGFSVERSVDDLHHTPSGAAQAFTYTVLRHEQ